MQHARMGLLGAVVLLLGLAAITPYRETPPFGAHFLAQVGGVGVQIGVLPNQYNSLNEQIAAKENELQLREAALARREAVFLSGVTREANIAGYSLAASGGLFLLLLLNFFLDYRVRHKAPSGTGLSPQ